MKRKEVSGFWTAASNQFKWNLLFEAILWLLIALWWSISIFRASSSQNNTPRMITSVILLSGFCILIVLMLVCRKFHSHKHGRKVLWIIFWYAYSARFYSVILEESVDSCFWGLNSIWYYWLAQNTLKTRNSLYTLLLANSLVVIVWLIVKFKDDFVWNIMDLIMFASGCILVEFIKYQSGLDNSGGYQQPYSPRDESMQSKMMDLSSPFPFAEGQSLGPSDRDWLAQLKEVLMLIPQGIIIFNEKMEIQSSNYSARKILNLDEKQDLLPESLERSLTKVTNLKVRQEKNEGVVASYLEKIVRGTYDIQALKDSQKFDVQEVRSGTNISTKDGKSLSKQTGSTTSNGLGMITSTSKQFLDSERLNMLQQNDLESYRARTTPQIMVAEMEKIQEQLEDVSFFQLLEFMKKHRILLATENEVNATLEKNIVIDGKYTVKGQNTSKILEFELFAVSAGRRGSLHSNTKIILTINDVTFREYVSVAENNSQFKDNLISSFSHELRTPLNQTLTYLECAQLEEGITTECKQKYLIPALKGCKFLLHSVKDIIDLSQLQLKKLQLAIREFNLKEALKECVDLFSAAVSMKSIKLHFEYGSQLPEIITSDRERICQVTTNLLSNAVKYTSPEGNIVVSCAVGKSNSEIMVSIKDDGQGMSSDDKRRLLDSFESWEFARRISSHSTGAGIGLYVSNQLARLLSRDEEKGLEIKSKEGAGSQFSFEIENRGWVKHSEEIVLPLQVRRRQRMSTYLKYNDIDPKNLLVVQTEKKQGAHTIASMRKGSLESPSSQLNLTPLKSRERGSKVTSIFEMSGNDQEEENHNSAQSEKIEISPTKLNSIEMNSSYLRKIDVQKRMTAPPKLIRASYVECKCNKVLIVDDDGSNISALEMMLSHFNIKADTACDGREAVLKYRERVGLPCGTHCKSYELILMDLNMPNKNGIEATVLIRDLERVNRLPPVKIVGCTAYVQNEMSSCLDAGMDTCYQKPIVMRVLKEILENYYYASKESSEPK